MLWCTLNKYQGWIEKLRYNLFTENYFPYLVFRAATIEPVNKSEQKQCDFTNSQ